MNSNKRNQAFANISPINSRIGENNKKKFLQELNNLNQFSANFDNDKNIPEYAQQILRQMTTLLQMAGSIIGEQVSMEEVLEEDKRQHCVVVSGVPESKATSPTARALEDRQQINNILDNAGVECIPTKTYRMGSSQQNFPRLIKVELPTRWHVKRLLGSKKKFEGNVKVRESLTKQQLIDRKNLFSLCKDQYKADPNCDCVIFAGHVMPRKDIPRFRQDPGNFQCICHH